MGRGRKGSQDGRSDQYGDTMTSQDRFQPSGFSGRGGGGGGEGGKRGRAGMDVSFVRPVPRFLQAHAHLLGSGRVPGEESAAQTEAREIEAEEAQDEADALEALRRAAEEDPSVLTKHPELQSAARAAEAAQLKQQGSQAFAAGKHEKAAELFGQCLELCPEDAIFWSNRSAARLALSDSRGAAADAERAARLRPGWAKAHARLGAALAEGGDCTRAAEAYGEAVRLEPLHEQYREALARAKAGAQRQEREGAHRFKRPAEGREVKAGGRRARGDAGAVDRRVKEAVDRGRGGEKRTVQLSFQQDGEEEEEDGGNAF